MIELGIGLIIILIIDIIICTYFAKTVDKTYNKEQKQDIKRIPQK